MLLIFICLGICTFGCCRIWPLPPQHRQTVPSFTLSLIVCFKGSGETNSICLKAFLARLCLLKLTVRYWFNTAGRTEPGPASELEVWLEACGYLGGIVSTGDHGKWERPLRIHSGRGLSASLKGSVTPFQERDPCHSPLPWSLFKLLLRKCKRSLSVSSGIAFPVLLTNSQGGSRHSSLVWSWA